jgi:hypothetical protein
MSLKDTIVYDSGCAVTIFNDRKWFKTLEPLAVAIITLSASGDMVQTTMSGVVSFTTILSTGGQTTMEVARALFQPKSPCNLLATMALRNEGVFWNQHNNTLYYENDTLAEMDVCMGVSVIKATPTVTNDNTATTAALVAVPYRTMHRRLMHASEDIVRKACQRAGISLTAKNDTFCEPCIMGKMTDEVGKQAPVEVNVLLDFIRIDTVLHKDASHLGYKYSLHIIDVWSNYQWVKFIRTKDGILLAFQEWVEMMENYTGRRIKIVGLDGGTEFGQASIPFHDDKFKAWARTKTIIVFTITPETLWMNGKIERAARSILDKSRSTMLAYNIPIYLWAFVVETTVQIANALPTRGNPDDQSPYERFVIAVNMPMEVHKPYLHYFRAYFCNAYYFIKPYRRVDSEKFAARVEKGRLVGYVDLYGKIYWIWNPETGAIVRASAVCFNEGLDYIPDDDVYKEAEFEAVFADSTTEEAERYEERWISVTIPDGDE